MSLEITPEMHMLALGRFARALKNCLDRGDTIMIETVANARMETEEEFVLPENITHYIAVLTGGDDGFMVYAGEDFQEALTAFITTEAVDSFDPTGSVAQG